MVRRMVMLLVALLLFGLPLTAQAQEWPKVYCGNLSEEDCNLLTQSQAAMAALDSAAFEMSFNFGLSSSEPFAPGVSEVAFDVQGSGAFAGEMPDLSAFQSMDPTQLGEIMSQAPALFIEGLRSVSGQASLTVNLPAELVAGEGVPAALPINLIMLDGVAYVDLASLVPAEASGADMPAWIGIDLAGMYESMLKQMPDDENLAGQMEQMQALFSSDVMTGLVDAALAADFVTVTRGADETIDGQTVAVFQTEIDYAALFGNEGFQTAMQEYMQSIMTMQGVDAEEMPEGVMEAMTSLMAGLKLTVTEKIGTEDYLVRQTAMDMSFDMDFAALAGMIPESEMGDVPDSFGMTLAFEIALSEFGQPVEVVAPEGAQVINPMTMIPPTSSAQ